jgi:hypothetical protein
MMLTQALEVFEKPTQQQLAKLTAKMLYELKYVEPMLGEDLFPYYRHYCAISVLGINYSQKRFGIYVDRTDKYDQIGHILSGRK